MQYIFENVEYFRCVGEVSALDGDVFKNSSLLVQINVTPNYRPSSYNLSFSQLVPTLEGAMKEFWLGINSATNAQA